MPKQETNGSNTIPLQESKEYKPSSWALSRIGQIPQNVREELKKIYSLDIAEVVKSSKRYGIVEGLAGNNFTLHPVHLSIDKTAKLKKEIMDKAGVSIEDADMLKWIPDMGKEEGWYTVRLWVVPETGKWGLETHEVKLGFAFDENGEAIKKEDKSDKLTWDRNALSENSAIRYRGRLFTKDQMDHLRLTGTLGSPLEIDLPDNKKSYVNVYLDEYNNHEVVAYNQEFTKLQLESKMKDRNIFYMDNKPYWLDASGLSEAASGGYVWAYAVVADPNDASKKVADKSCAVNVWFDPRTRQFRPTIAGEPSMDFEKARNEEIKRNKAEAKKNQKPKGVSETKQVKNNGPRK